MKILICDDEQTHVNTLRIYIEEYMRSHHIRFEITATTDAAQILAMDKRFDLAILDIQMDALDGISLAKKLKKQNSRIALFFVTNYDEYQDDAMDLQAFRFFQKPFQTKRLYAGLDKAMEYIDGAYIDIFLSEKAVCQKVIVDDILYVTREGRKTSLITRQEEYTLSEKYDVFCECLPQRFFYPVHKSFFVNLHYVQRYSYTELILSNGVRIPIAPRRQSAFHKFWFEYLRRR